MRGKVARQLRNLCNYKEDPIIPPRLLVVDRRKGHKLVLNSEGEYKHGDIAYDIVEQERDITRLSCDPTRQVYKDLKKQWYSFTADDHKRVQKQDTTGGINE